MLIACCGAIKAAERNPSFLERNWLIMLLYWQAVEAQCWDVNKELISVKTVKKGSKIEKVHTYKETPVFKPTRIPATVARMYIYDRLFSLFRAPISLVYAPFKWSAQTLLGCTFRSPEYYKAGLLSRATALGITLDLIKNGMIRAKVHQVLSTVYAHAEHALKQTATYKNMYSQASRIVAAAHTKVSSLLSNSIAVKHDNVGNKTAQNSSKKAPDRRKIMGKQPMANTIGTRNTNTKNPHTMYTGNKARSNYRYNV